ncbi:MAG TPA: MarR family transcriptional regulator [Candidatus Cybelea sp.]
MPRRAAANEPTKRRRDLLAQLETAGREMSTAMVAFHTTVAAKVGLSPIEEKAIDILARRGPLRARAVAKETGLAPASVTGLLDRLERGRWIRRIRNPEDGRSILIELRPDALQRIAGLFEDFVRSLGDLYSRRSNDELETILGFMSEAARRQTEATSKLRGAKARSRS